MRPVVSFNHIKKGIIERPANGLDRFTLTEIGETVMRSFRKTDMKIKVRRANPPFPWEMAFKENGLEVAHLNGHFIGPSTFRSIFRFRYLEGTTGDILKKDLITSLDRPPLESRYWNNDTWSRFTQMVGLSRDEVMDQNASSI